MENDKDNLLPKSVLMDSILSSIDRSSARSVIPSWYWYKTQAIESKSAFIFDPYHLFEIREELLKVTNLILDPTSDIHSSGYFCTIFDTNLSIFLACSFDKSNILVSIYDKNVDPDVFNSLYRTASYVITYEGSEKDVYKGINKLIDRVDIITPLYITCIDHPTLCKKIYRIINAQKTECHTTDGKKYNICFKKKRDDLGMISEMEIGLYTIDHSMSPLTIVLDREDVVLFKNSMRVIYNKYLDSMKL